jgi:uncharacterized protein (DUF1501 family)
MMTLLGRKQRYCDNMSRRDFLRIGAFGSALTMTDILRAQSQPAEGQTTRHKAAIMIWLNGGPPHLDMYDLKPDAPENIRGEFKPIQTNVPGVQICELMPLQARMWDKFAVIRSLVSKEDHIDTEAMTGYPEAMNRNQAHPSFGSLVSKLREGYQPSVPAFVSLRGLTKGQEPGPLGVAHRAFTPTGEAGKNLRLPEGVSTAQLNDRKNLLASFDSMRRDLDATGTAHGLDAMTARAFDMVSSGAMRNALDLSREEQRSRERYRGIEQFLIARRLVEAGVSCVTLSFGGWDLHGSEFGEGAHCFKGCRKQLPMLDRAVTQLIQDLHDRGMQDDVVTAMWGEFGRSPRITPTGGRDHWPQVMSALVAGGGLKMGQAVGSSSSRGEYPKDRPYHVTNLLSTMYRVLGIDPAKQFLDSTGRPRYILDDREPVAELL